MSVPIPVFLVLMIGGAMTARAMKAYGNAKPIRAENFSPELTQIQRHFDAGPRELRTGLLSSVGSLGATPVSEGASDVFVKVPTAYLAVRMVVEDSEGGSRLVVQGRRTSSQVDLADAEAAFRNFEGALVRDLQARGVR